MQVFFKVLLLGGFSLLPSERPQNPKPQRIAALQDAGAQTDAYHHSDWFWSAVVLCRFGLANPGWPRWQDPSLLFFSGGSQKLSYPFQVVGIYQIHTVSAQFTPESGIIG